MKKGKIRKSIISKVIVSMLAVIMLFIINPMHTNAAQNPNPSIIDCATITPGDGQVKVTITNPKPDKLYAYSIWPAAQVEYVLSVYTSSGAAYAPVESFGAGNYYELIAGSVIIPATNGDELNIIVFELDPLEITGKFESGEDAYGYWIQGAQHLAATPQEGLSNDDGKDAKVIEIAEVNVTELGDIKDKIEVNVSDENAFSKSVELRLTDNQNSKDAFALAVGADNGRIIAFDISLYIKDTNDKTQPESGYTVTIKFPLPTELWEQRDGVKIGHIADDGKLEILDSVITKIDGVYYIEFTTNHFSPYALLVNVDISDDNNNNNNNNNGENIKTDEQSSEDTPQTGDNASSISLMIVAMIGVMGVVLASKRKKNNRVEI